MPANIKKSRRSTTKERHDHLTAWKNSGLKMSEYCRENDISISSFSTWNKRQESIKPKELRAITTNTCKQKQHPWVLRFIAKIST